MGRTSPCLVPPDASVPGPCEPEDLLDGVIFGAKYLGSTQLISERNPPTSVRMAQAQEAVDRIKVQEGKGHNCHQPGAPCRDLLAVGQGPHGSSGSDLGAWSCRLRRASRSPWQRWSCLSPRRGSRCSRLTRRWAGSIHMDVGLSMVSSHRLEVSVCSREASHANCTSWEPLGSQPELGEPLMEGAVCPLKHRAGFCPLQEAMMDHSLQTISYIADIGSLVVLMARRKLPRQAPGAGEKRLYTMICHVFHSADVRREREALGRVTPGAWASSCSNVTKRSRSPCWGLTVGTGREKEPT